MQAGRVRGGIHLPQVGDEEGRVDDAERGQLDGGPVEVAQVREERLRACMQETDCLRSTLPYCAIDFPRR